MTNTLTLTYTGKLVIVTCGVCTIPHAIPEELYERCQQREQHWFCPAGHELVFTTTDYAKIKDQLARAKRERDWARTARTAAEDQAKTAEYRRRAAAGQLTKIKRRVANGVCPCCGRTFADLAAHMSAKHPGFEAAGEQ